MSYWVGHNNYKGDVTLFYRGIKHLVLVLVLLSLTACKDPLFTKLKEENANEMMAILLQNGIDVDKEIDKKDRTLMLSIGKSDIPNALKLLKRHGYPRESYANITDVFSKEGLISSPLEERVRYIYALTQEVQETLAQIDGVITARVHVVLPKNDPFEENITPSSASVFIKYVPGSNLKDIQSDIKFIVEKSIEGLRYEKISIVMLPAMELTDEQGEGEWTNVLGVRLPQESLGAFQFVLGILLLLLLLALAMIVFLLKRLGMQLNDDFEDEEKNLSNIAIEKINETTAKFGENSKHDISTTPH